MIGTRTSAHDRQAMTLIELLVAMGILAALSGLALAAVQRGREAAARLKCQNNVRQLALALHQFHDANNSLPPGHRSLRNRDLMPFSGWPVSVLPYSEQQTLAAQARTAFRFLPFPFINPPH